MIRSNLLAIAVSAGVACNPALAQDASERKFIRERMTDAEVLAKIGKPDQEVFTRAVRGEPEEKVWTYLPHSLDAQTITVITFKSGLVTRLERKISR